MADLIHYYLNYRFDFMKKNWKSGSCCKTSKNKAVLAYTTKL